MTFYKFADNFLRLKFCAYQMMAMKLCAKVVIRSATMNRMLKIEKAAASREHV